VNANEQRVFLFPGQGTIPDAVACSHPIGCDLYALAEQSGLPLREWIANGDNDRLRQTDAAQPAIFIDSIVKYMALRESGMLPMAVAGHSLGEYGALVAGGVLDPLEALRVIIERGRLMGLVEGGGMAAIVKLPAEQVSDLCDRLDVEISVANINGPMQVVISGNDDALAQAMSACEGAGGRAIKLNVSGPFHSPLMAGAEAALEPMIEELCFRAPSVPFVSSVSGHEERDPLEIKELLLTQITACVQWVSVIESLVQMNIDAAVEVGAGRVLTGLGARITKEIEFSALKEVSDGAI